MTIPERVRLYHAALAALVLSAYASGELGPIHEWLGYAVAFVVAFRIFWGLLETRQLGISRFFPTFAEMSRVRWFDHPAVSKILLSGVAAALISTVVTGILLDRLSAPPKSFRMETGVSSSVVDRRAPSNQDQRGSLAVARYDERENTEGETWIGEVHEASANLLLALVAVHATYVLLFKRRLAAFMLFYSGRHART